MFKKEELIDNIFEGNCFELLKQYPDNSLDCVVTSPPYWGLRNYNTAHYIWKGDKPLCKGEHEWKLVDKKINDYTCTKCGAWKGELGTEPYPELFVDHLTQIFEEVRRALKPTGTCWVNIGDTYFSKEYKKHSYLKGKDICGVPWMMAVSFQKAGWILRNDIIWHKPNSKPESIKDRCTKSHEYIFFFTKEERYTFNQDPIREKMLNKTKKPSVLSNRDARAVRPGTTTKPNELGRNKRSVWSVNAINSNIALGQLRDFKDFEYHHAIYSEKLIEPCVLGGSNEGDLVFDPFMGSGTTAVVAMKNKRKYTGCELNPDYRKIQKARFASIDLDRIHGNNALDEIISFE